MVMDSLRYCVEVCHVDGFRFDLATTLARGPAGYDRPAGLLTPLRPDPFRPQVKLFAWPWHAGTGGYTVAPPAHLRAVGEGQAVRRVGRTAAVPVTLANGSASITAAELDGGTDDNWGVESLGASRTTFSCSDIGAQKVVLSAVDKGGNSASAESTVQVLGHVPQPSISVTPAAGDATGLPSNTIALGYGPQSVTLSASDAAGASTFSWSPAGGLSSAVGAVTSFAPTAAGSFSFTAQAASPESCFAQATATVNVIDARCGEGKVMVCNKTGSESNPGTQVCVSPNAVPAFLKKGSVLGACAG